jgi:hypothetical protein
MEKLVGHAEVAHAADFEGKTPQQIAQFFPGNRFILGTDDLQSYASLHWFTPNNSISAFRLSGLTVLPELLVSGQD